MIKRFTLSASLFLCAILFFGPIRAQVTQIWTDYNNALWTSSSTSINATRPENNHNLLAFRFNGTTYSTGANNAMLNANSVSYTAGSWKALPVSSLPTSGTSYFVALGQSADGVNNGYNTTTPPFSGSPISASVLASFLTDGINGLNIGTGLANIPSGLTLRFNLSNNGIVTSAVNDGVPDILFAQIASPSSGGDQLRFVNSSGSTVGNAVLFNLSNTTNYPVVANWMADFYNPNATGGGAGFFNTQRPISLFAADLSAFGITAGNLSQVVALEYITGGTADPAFIAYNEPSINIPKVKVVSQPNFYSTGTAMSPSFQVGLEDENGNLLAQAGLTITASLESGPGGLSGTLTATTNASGIATFSNLTITAASGGIHKIKFSNPNYVPVVSSNINCSATASGSPVTITIVESGGTTCGWSVTDRVLTAVTNVSINKSEMVNLLLEGNLTIETGLDIVVNAVIEPALRSNVTFTLKAGRDITFNAGRRIAPTLAAMNVVLWANSSGGGRGDVFFDANTDYSTPVAIRTNGGHLWIGGGSGSTSWNGLTVGNDYAVGGTARSVGGTFVHTNGITIVATDIQTSGGQIQMRGKSAPGNAPTNYSGGMYLVGTGTMNSGGGNIDIDVTAQAGTGRKYGLYNLGAYSFTPGSGNLTIVGDASAVSSPDNGVVAGRGVFLWTSVAAISTSGNITFIGSGAAGTTTGVDIRTAITTTGGAINYQGNSIFIDANHTANTNITLTTNNLTIGTSRLLSSTGTLVITPLTASAIIGIGGAAGTLQLPASFFTTNFADGFASITIGSATQSGNINANPITLLDPMAIRGTGTLNLGGLITLGNNNITLGNSLSVSGSSSAYFRTNGTGSVQRSIGTGSNFTFPIGNSSYNPVQITNVDGAADDFQVKVRDEVLQNGTTGSSVSGFGFVQRTWDVGKSSPSGPGGVNMTFNWTSGNVSGVIGTAALFHYGSGWQRITGTQSSTATSFTISGYTGSFSPFAVKDASAVLPVRLLSFNGRCTNGNTELNWATATETNSSHFIVERNDINNTWIHVGRVTAAGNSSRTQQYRHVITGVDGAARYRLRQVDLDGHESFSSVVTIRCSDRSNLIRVYPNPAITQVWIDGMTAETPYRITNAQGAQVAQGIIRLDNRGIDVSRFAHGTYYLHIPTPTGYQSLPFQVTK